MAVLLRRDQRKEAPPANRDHERAWFAQLQELAASGDGWYDPVKIPASTPNFLYGLLAPYWAEANQLIRVDWQVAATLASRLGDEPLYIEDQNAYALLVDRTIDTPNRKARLHKHIIDAINGLPDGSERTSLFNSIVGASLGRSVVVRPTNELVEAIYEHAFGWGPLEPLMSDPTVTEIMVNAHDRIFVERTIPGVGSQLVPVLDTFESPMVLRRFIERMVEQTKDKTIDFENPTVDLSLPDGSRVNATIPPASRLGPTITIRRKRERFYSLDELQEFGAFSPEMRQFLHESNISGANMMSFGPTGSGKTTLLTALIDDKPRDRRIIVVEDTPEINIDINRHPNFISMLTSERRSMRDLVRNALRQRPDHLIVGETRDATAYDLIQAFNSGQTGSMSTIHARDPQSALVRLTNLVRQAEAAPTEEPARRMVAEAIHLLIFAARLPDGSRRIISIDEVLDLDDAFNFRTQNVFSLSIAGRDQKGRLNVTFVHNPNYVMGPSLAKLFADAGYDPEAWTGSIARAEGRRPELLMY